MLGLVVVAAVRKRQRLMKAVDQEEMLNMNDDSGRSADSKQQTRSDSGTTDSDASPSHRTDDDTDRDETLDHDDYDVDTGNEELSRTE